MITRNAAGFTLLELMLVLLLLGSITGLIVATLPRADGRPQAEKLMLTLRRASAQAETGGQALSLQVSARGWQLFRLAPGGSGQPAFLPGYHWQPVNRAFNQRLPAAITLQVYRQQRPLTLPARLLFLPGGSSGDLRFTLTMAGAQPRHVYWHNERAVLEDQP